MKKIRTRSTNGLMAGAALIVSASTMLAGCEDGDAKARAELGKKIQDATEDLNQAAMRASAPGDEGDAIRSQLRSIGSSLTGARDGSKGQQAAAFMVTGTANRLIASMDFVDLNERETAQHHQRAAASAKLDAIVRMAKAANGLEGIDTSQQSAQLDSARSQASAMLSTLSRTLADLDAPIAELTSATQARSTESRSLRERSTNLLRQARQLSYREAFPLYEQSISARREADKIDFAIVQQELELDYQHKPEHAQTNTQVNSVQSLIGTLDRSKQDLNAVQSDLQSQVRSIRQQINGSLSDLAATLNAMGQERSGALGQMYDAAVAAANKAAGDAGSAARNLGRDGNSAKMAQTLALELKGRILALRARGASDMLALVAKFAAAQAAAGGSSSQFSQLLSSVQQEQDNARRDAVAALDQARTIVQPITDNKAIDQITAFIAGLDQTIAALGGAPSTSDGN